MLSKWEKLIIGTGNFVYTSECCVISINAPLLIFFGEQSPQNLEKILGQKQRIFKHF